MKKYIVLGVNENPKYMYYLPLVIWAWRQFGWDAIVFNSANDTSVRVLATHGLMVRTIPKDYNLNNILFTDVHGYKSETVAQVARLYAACVVDQDSYLMTSDVDMLPLSKNIFHYEGHRVLAIGRDLTDYHYPICYIGARAYIWHRFMKFIGHDYQSVMRRDMRQQKNMWGLDQDIVTEKLLAYGIENINHVNRGTDKRTGYPLGRVDRSNWRLDHAQLIDAHLPHDILTNDASFHKVMELLHHCWPKEDFKWFLTYHREFKKLL